MKQIYQSILIAVIVISMILGIKYYLNVPDNNRKEVVSLTDNKECNQLKSECEYKFGNKIIRIGFLDSVQTMKTFKVKVAVDNFDEEITGISALFSMKSMDMGLNRFDFKKVSQESTSLNNWYSSVLLPVCTTKRTDWIMTVNIETQKKIYQTITPLQIK